MTLENTFETGGSKLREKSENQNSNNKASENEDEKRLFDTQEDTDKKNEEGQEKDNEARLPQN